MNMFNVHVAEDARTWFQVRDLGMRVVGGYLSPVTDAYNKKVPTISRFCVALWRVRCTQTSLSLSLSAGRHAHTRKHAHASTHTHHTQTHTNIRQKVLTSSIRSPLRACYLFDCPNPHIGPGTCQASYEDVRTGG